MFVDRRLRPICYIMVLSLLSFSSSPSRAASPSPDPEQAIVASKALRLSVNDALGLFISQNLDVLIAKYGIEYSKGQQITAAALSQSRGYDRIGRLVLHKAVHSRTAGSCSVKSSSCSNWRENAVTGSKARGYGSQSAEAAFEDAVRHLGFTVKDTYYRIQLAQRG